MRSVTKKHDSGGRVIKWVSENAWRHFIRTLSSNYSSTYLTKFNKNLVTSKPKLFSECAKSGRCCINGSGRKTERSSSSNSSFKIHAKPWTGKSFVNMFFDGAKVQSSGSRTRLTIKRTYVRILSHPTLDENGVKAMPGSNPAPVPGFFIKKNENLSSQIKNIKKHL